MIQQSTFTIERNIKASIDKVWKAFSDPATKAKWFQGPEGEEEQKMDFREGGREKSRGKIEGSEHEFRSHYYDIVENERIVYTYEMYVDGKRISISLASLQFEKGQDSTKLTLTESGIYLDGLDKPEQRQQGTGMLLDQLTQFLEKTNNSNE